MTTVLKGSWIMLKKDINLLRISAFYFKFERFRKENVVQKHFYKLCYTAHFEQICNSVILYRSPNDLKNIWNLMKLIHRMTSGAD
jgi:hypothetical protein